MLSSLLFHLMKASFELPATGLGVLLYHCGLAPLLIWLRRRSPRVLMFHAVEEQESDFIRGLSINATPAHFAAQLEFLTRCFNIVPMSEYGTKALPERALFITFDDGLRSVYQHAFPMLKAAGAPATCYLNTDVIGNRSMIWLNEITWHLHRDPERAGPTVAGWLGISRMPSRRRLIKRLIAAYDRRGISELLEKLRESTGTAPEELAREASIYLDWQEIEEMARSGVNFGNHTGSHAVLSRLSEEDCRDELARARAALERVSGSIPSLAYPFGLANLAARRIAIELGYTTLLLTEGLNYPVDPTRVGRLNVTSILPSVLFARMEIVAPIKARVKRFFVASRDGVGRTS